MLTADDIAEFLREHPTGPGFLEAVYPREMYERHRRERAALFPQMSDDEWRAAGEDVC